MLAVFGGEPALDVGKALREAMVPIDWPRDHHLVGAWASDDEFALLNACLGLEHELRAAEYARLGVWLEACAAAGPGSGPAMVWRLLDSLKGGGPVDEGLARRGFLAVCELGWLSSEPEPRVPAGLVGRHVGQAVCGRRVRSNGSSRRRRR